MRRFAFTALATVSIGLGLFGCTPSNLTGSDNNNSSNGDQTSGTTNNNSTGGTTATGDGETTTSTGNTQNNGVSGTGTSGNTAPPSTGGTDYVSDTPPSSAVGDIMPNALSIDISDLPDDTSSKEDLASQSSANFYRRTEISTAAIVNAFHRYADRSILVAKKIQANITDPNQTNVSGSFVLNGTTVSYKADFSAFDIDGDGVPDGSGTAAADPVAIRMWVDRGEGYQPFLCALITHRPANGNLGAGVLYAHPSAVFANASDTFQYEIQWDRTDDSHKWNLANLEGRAREFYTLTKGVARVDQRNEGGGVINKTVRANGFFSESSVRLDHLLTSVVYHPGSGQAMMSSNSSDGAASIAFTDSCVNLADFSENKDGACDTYDKQDDTFLAEPTGTEATFPADFPATPTF